MIPLSLILIQMGKSGLELIKAYPESLPEKELNKIVFKCMPLGAEDKDFITLTVEKRIISTFIFTISRKPRNNIAALTAVFVSEDYQPQFLKRLFSYTITELQNKDLLTIDILTKILPEIYNGIVDKKYKIKINAEVTLEFQEDQKDDEKNSFDSFGDDVWN
ncbi:MAG: hypothetical protein ACTSQH_07340 [Candidatus Hodarchaeales archaeon]